MEAQKETQDGDDDDNNDDDDDDDDNNDDDNKNKGSSKIFDVTKCRQRRGWRASNSSPSEIMVDSRPYKLTISLRCLVWC